MKKKIKVVGIGGSLSPASTSLASLKIALTGASEDGAEVSLFDIREMALPMFYPDYKEIPKEAEVLIEALSEAQGLIWSSPMYHGTVSGSFKNALDWLHPMNSHKPPYLTDKVIGLVSTAGGVQGLQAVNTMEFVVRSLRGWAVPMVLPIPQVWQVFDEKGKIKDKNIEEQLKGLGKEVYRAALQFSHTGTCDYAQIELHQLN